MSREIDFDIVNHLPRIRHELADQIELKIKQAAIMVDSEVKRLLAGPRSGKRYRVPATRRFYTASSAGEPPAVRTGQLRQRYRFRIDGNGWDTVGLVGNPLDYAAYLEAGTSKMSPREHLRLAYMNKKAPIIASFRELL